MLIIIGVLFSSDESTVLKSSSLTDSSGGNMSGLENRG